MALVLIFIAGLTLIVVYPQIIKQLWSWLLGSIILTFGFLVLALLVIQVTKYKIDVPLRELALQLSKHELVDFHALLANPDHARDVQVYPVDIDGDGKFEWVVFYRFELSDGRRPYAGVVYDYDRGNPPVLFPYRLIPPHRDYLGEEWVRLELRDVVSQSELVDKPALELMVYGQSGGLNTDLTIFRHVRNSLEWEPPRDVPPRYQVVGAFRGDGGVRFDPATKQVTVIDRYLERSQLAVEFVYKLDEERGSYMSRADPMRLNPPISQRVTFAFGMPPDILDTPYPEKLVLGFYEMLGTSSPRVNPRAFLTGQALLEYDRGNFSYFGLRAAPGTITDLRVTSLQYYPEVEARDVLQSSLGEQPRFMLVSLTLEGWKGYTFTPARVEEPIEWLTTWVEGKWKIDRRADLQ
ncbi:MAG: hypothetical protein DDG58_12765 [Ardenticatenia bacterium]|nr:MAG: hypothetical protein DDG58_12765 [Ardenticatenia bacterium]